MWGEPCSQHISRRRAGRRHRRAGAEGSSGHSAGLSQSSGAPTAHGAAIPGPRGGLIWSPEGGWTHSTFHPQSSNRVGLCPPPCLGMCSIAFLCSQQCFSPTGMVREALLLSLLIKNIIIRFFLMKQPLPAGSFELHGIGMEKESAVPWFF